MRTVRAVWRASIAAVLVVASGGAWAGGLTVPWAEADAAFRAAGEALGASQRHAAEASEGAATGVGEALAEVEAGVPDRLGVPVQDAVGVAGIVSVAAAAEADVAALLGAALLENASLAAGRGMDETAALGEEGAEGSRTASDGTFGALHHTLERMCIDPAEARPGQVACVPGSVGGAGERSVNAASSGGEAAGSTLLGAACGSAQHLAAGVAGFLPGVAAPALPCP